MSHISSEEHRIIRCCHITNHVLGHRDGCFFFCFFFLGFGGVEGGCSRETINLPPVRQDGGSVRRAVEKNSECFVALIEKQSSRVTTRKLAFTGLL